MVAPDCGWLGGLTAMLTEKSTFPARVGLKLIDVGKLCPGARVKGPAGEIENNPTMSGMVPDNVPLPVFRNVIRFVTE
jgi:hypothetical protein